MCQPNTPPFLPIFFGLGFIVFIDGIGIRIYFGVL